MTVKSKSLKVVKPLFRYVPFNCSPSSSKCCMTTTASSSKTRLPLAGIRVLDMTRVLAGVGLDDLDVWLD